MPPVVPGPPSPSATMAWSWQWAQAWKMGSTSAKRNARVRTGKSGDTVESGRRLERGLDDEAGQALAIERAEHRRRHLRVRAHSRERFQPAQDCARREAVAGMPQLGRPRSRPRRHGRRQLAPGGVRGPPRSLTARTTSVAHDEVHRGSDGREASSSAACATCLLFDTHDLKHVCRHRRTLRRHHGVDGLRGANLLRADTFVSSSLPLCPAEPRRGASARAVGTPVWLEVVCPSGEARRSTHRASHRGWTCAHRLRSADRQRPPVRLCHNTRQFGPKTTTSPSSLTTRAAVELP
jgi:hypothetical protein